MDHFGFALIKHPVKVYVCPFSSFMATIKLEEPKKKLEEKMSRVNWIYVDNLR